MVSTIPFSFDFTLQVRVLFKLLKQLSSTQNCKKLIQFLSQIFFTLLIKSFLHAGFNFNILRLNFLAVVLWANIFLNNINELVSIWLEMLGFQEPVAVV